MNSKKKNKNRQNKPPNPTPPQKKEEVIEPVSPLEEKIESVVEERVPNIVSENVSVEVKEPDDAPQKPKRHKGKKKKEDDKSDKEDNVTFIEPALVPETQPVKDELEDTNIAPTARKKKNKNKKNQQSEQEQKVDAKEIQREIKIQESDSKSQEIQKTNETETEGKSSKKKNKKKKNRTDSERSDKEEISCTSAFQKLLVEEEKSLNEKTEKNTPPATDKSSVSEATVKEVELANVPSDMKSQEDASQKDEGHKSKKKNKKDKKISSNDLIKPAENIQTPETMNIEEKSIPCKVVEVPIETTVNENTETFKLGESIPSTSSSESQSLKLKAKIAKPVDKKKKGKSQNVEEVKTIEVEQLPVIALSETETLPIRTLLETVPHPEINPDWHEEVKTDEGNGPVVGCEDKNEVSALTLQREHLEKNKKRKKSPKPTKTNETVISPVLPVDKTSIVTKHDEVKVEEKSSSSSQQAKLKKEKSHEVKPENAPELLSKDQKGHIEITDSDKKIDKEKLSPKSQVKNEKPRPEKSADTVQPEVLNINEPKSQALTDYIEKLELKSDQLISVKSELIVEETEAKKDKMEHTKIIGNDEKREKGKKSTEHQKKHEITAPEMPAITEQSAVIKIDKSKINSATNYTDKQEFETNQSIEVKQKKAGREVEAKTDETDSIKIPDKEKKQKRKKSPKLPINIDVASGSKSTTEKGENTAFTIDDLIIIQAEVVSDETAPKCETVITSEVTTQSQDTMQNISKSDKENPKTSKKSPKPSKTETGTQFHTAAENTKAKGSCAAIEMPATPKPGDLKLSPGIVPVELDMPKVEPVVSPSDITPDFIEYPRCSSEQLLDTNNNMVIQEISQTETKLAVPIVLPDTPFIKGTDLLTPVTENKKKPSEEKTDLKSKVMEVNQDMEELRLSIERSLAELTSLDKTEKEADKKIEEENKGNLMRAKKIEIESDLPKKHELLDSIVFEEIPVERKETPLEPVAEEKSTQEPICPERKDRKGKGKSKKKGKQEVAQSPISQPTSTPTDSKQSTQSQDTNKEDSTKSDKKSENKQEKEKQQSSGTKGNKDDDINIDSNCAENAQSDFEPIENFEDAMTSSVDDVNKTFEIIANEANPRLNVSQNNPEINIIAPQEDDKNGREEKQNPVSPPKNLLGHPDIPAPSSKTDYKKEKNKTPNCRQAKVKIKDSNQVEIQAPDKSKQSKESQTENKRKFLNHKNFESICVTNKNEDYVYKYSFRKVFLQSACHVCKKDLTQTRVPCSYCNLIFYCNQKHKDEDYAQHQALCFAVSTIVHLKDQKYIYADAQNITGHNYRLLRMQIIVSCEKVLKRRLAPWEQEALLYPRICADAGCREWRQGKLKDCERCGQISYCSEHPDHLPKSHVRWCKSYNLYRALVHHQQTHGRLEPKLPTRVVELSPLPDNINEVLANMYEERIDMSDIEYAALTQLATAPLTALYCLQAYNKINSKVNGVTKKAILTLHIVGAELQFEADVLNKWEVFLMHLVPGVKELRVALVGPDLNPSNLPLELLGKIKLCQNCQQNKRHVVFDFQDKRTYHEFWASDDFTTPDLICAFNPSIQRSSNYNGKDTWPSTINCILKQKSPFVITSYTLSELTGDLLRIQDCSGVEHSVVCAPKTNSFASVRPDRNFISDDEAPLLFKNHCVTVVCGV